MFTVDRDAHKHLTDQFRPGSWVSRELVVDLQRCGIQGGFRGLAGSPSETIPVGAPAPGFARLTPVAVLGVSRNWPVGRSARWMPPRGRTSVHI